MSVSLRAIAACVIVAASSSAARGQEPEDRVALVVTAGRPLRVKLSERITIKRVGQTVTATVVDPLYAYDRIVVPAGATVTGRIETFESPSRWSRARAMLAGDFTPRRTPVVRFDTLTLSGGTTLPISTVIGTGRERVTLSTTTAAAKTGVVERGKEEAKGRAKAAIAAVKQRVRDGVAAVKAPGKMQRLKDAAVAQLPYHPQYLRAGTMYTAELTAPLSFGEAPTAEHALSEDPPAPQSVLTARLVTPLDSAKTPRGTAMRAIITEPVFSADHRLILPEGATLEGEVTFAKHAASMHRNGQLRFLIERVQAPQHESKTLLASLYAVESQADDRLVVDDEGGARATSSKTRFIAPALAVLSLHAAAEQHHRRFDNDADDNEPIRGQANIAGRGLSGWFGFGLIGAGLGQISRPVAIAFGAYGAGRTIYSNVFGKGHDVVFPANTMIEVQLSPGAGARTP